MVRVVDQQNVIYISEVSGDLVFFFVRCAKWIFFRFCRKNSALSPDSGSPIASPCFWIMIFPLLEKQFCIIEGFGYYLASSCDRNINPLNAELNPTCQLLT